MLFRSKTQRPFVAALAAYEANYFQSSLRGGLSPAFGPVFCRQDLPPAFVFKRAADEGRTAPRRLLGRHGYFLPLAPATGSPRGLWSHVPVHRRIRPRHASARYANIRRYKHTNELVAQHTETNQHVHKYSCVHLLGPVTQGRHRRHTSPWRHRDWPGQGLHSHTAASPTTGAPHLGGWHLFRISEASD